MTDRYPLGVVAGVMLLVGVPAVLASQNWAPEGWGLFIVAGFPVFLSLTAILLIASVLDRLSVRRVIPLVTADAVWIALQILVAAGLARYIVFYIGAA